MKTITDEMCETGVNVNKPIQDIIPKNQHYIRQLNKGKSFSFSKWSPLSKYTNDAIRQDFVSYKNAILACKISHVASSEPVLIYDKTGRATGVSSREWIFVISSSINYNNYYIDGKLTNNLGAGLSLEDGKIVATSGAILEENIQLNIDLSNEYPAGHIFERGTSVQEVLNAIFTSTRLGRGDGIQMYTQEMLDEMEDIPEQYVQIPSPTDLNKVSESGKTYLDIMFSAIRSLQAEVAKMRNAFKYGMQSYTGTDTTMSEVVNDIAKDEEEPLWATDENDLSLTSYHLNFDESEIPFTNPENIDVSTPGVAKIKGNTSWTDYQGELIESPDSKIYIYTTTDSLNSNYNFISDGSTININLNSIWQHNSLDKYNTLVILSRKVLINDVLCGNNYIWISISNPKTNTPILEGYYNPDKNKVQSSIYLLDDIYNLEKITLFAEQNLYKFDIYTKYQDFSIDVQASIPTDTDYKYKVAHLTIRSVDNSQELAAVKPYLLNNELIWQADTNRLLIKTNDTIVPIGGTVDPDTGMTETEVIEKLKEMGIISNNDDGLTLNPVADITFVHSGTGKQFKFSVNPEGELIGEEVPNKTLADRIEDLKHNQKTISTETSYRAFIARLLCAENSKDPFITSDVGTCADRVLITAVYCPLSSDTKFGCTHGYIELENTSESDIPLEGCYLHFLRPNSIGGFETLHLPLKGILRSGSTYLIRCKKYTDFDLDVNAVINVESYDQEWYINGELLDLTISDTNTPYAFALTYGLYDNDGSEINEQTSLWIHNNNTQIPDQQRQTWKWYYIDSLVFNKNATDATWSDQKVTAPSNSIVKRTFSLDPAKQAFTGTTLYDSSRYRNQNTNTDIQIVDLNDFEISFPHSTDTYPIERYTPKASKLRKSVSTDKTKLDMEKPNMVTCSFGIDAYTTRCFNWISAGQFDEYVFLKNGDSWIPFESYKSIDNVISEEVQYPKRKEFQSTEVNNTIYARMHGVFPGFDVKYTSHKCILKIVESAVDTKTQYTYIVGRKKADGTPDFNHCSEEYTFTLYPTSAKPRIYQTTDQQGFHWVEYQVWAAAALKINEQIESDCMSDNIIPVLVNTGDMTQNGTRINEWLDYYSAGKSLFKHLEQMNIVGNNDLCGTDPFVLGTGNDIGKSNGYYFHVFYCYEINESDGIVPLIQGNDGIKRYVPSIYYFDFDQLRMLMCNSEITLINCRDWFKKTDNNSTINIYTGWTVPNSSTEGTPKYVEGFTTIYTMLYNILNENKEGKNRKVIAVCHEMPFTVITRGSMSTNDNVKSNPRSFNTSTSSLIGCHMNQLSVLDTKGIYWFSRLLEHFGVKLCIGGHKHTYAVTHPLREMYYWPDNGELQNSCTTPKQLTNTLADDNLIWTDGDNIHLSKLPIVNEKDYSGYNYHSESGYIHPLTIYENDTYPYPGVVYYMCQATGYKLTSNKELPSPFQEFAQLIPSTGQKSDGSDSPDSSQRRPMFSIINCDETGVFKIALIRIENILYIKDEKGFNFTQTTHGKDVLQLNYAYKSDEKSRFCEWKSDRSYIIQI